MSSRSQAAIKVPTLEVPRERFELGCGVKLVVSPRPGASVTALRMHFRGGRSLEPEDRVGLGALAGQLIDQGTTEHDESEIANLLEPNGGQIGGGATGLAGSIAGGGWGLLLELACEMATRPTYPAPLVELHKERVASRIVTEAESPRFQAELRFRQLVYGKHWMARNARGTLETLAAITPAQLRSFHGRLWVPNRCTIAVCGDVDPRKVKRRLDTLLKDWKPRSARSFPVPDIPEPGVRVDAFPREREQVHLYLGHLGIRRKDPDYAALTVMDHILGTGPGFTNRIARRLRDEMGLAYSVDADIHSSAGIVRGVFAAYIGTSPEHVGTAIDGFLKEIKRIQARKVTAAELETARNYLLGSFAMGFERASRRASYLVEAEIHDFPDDYLVRLPREFAGVDLADVQRVAREHLLPGSCCLSAGGPISKRELAAFMTRR
ncbi:MAG: insulinase family protein [bacterium]|nr:insulinase family protein [bacterium]